jgi:glycosyltransferase involved in cell wall biosynthesis
VTTRSLVVTHTAPWPARSGGAIRAAHTISALRRLGPVDVVSIVQPERVEGAIPPPGEVARHLALARPPRRTSRYGRVQRMLTSSLPALRDGDFSDARRRFRQWCGDYDLIWLGNGTEAFVALGDVLPSGVPLVANLDDLEDRKIRAEARLDVRGTGSPAARIAAGARRVTARLETGRWAALHRRLLDRVDRLVVCSDAERAALAGNVGSERVVVVPNVYDEPSSPLGSIDVGVPPTLSLIGTLHYGPNVDGARFLVRSVLPEVVAGAPDVELRLVGRAGPEVAGLGSLPNVVVAGEVDDLAAELARADVVVVPLRYGGGTRIKILEAFAHRIPVVSTTLGAEGLGLTPGRQLLVADDPRTFAAACVRALGDVALRRRLVQAAHDHWYEGFRPEVFDERVHAVVGAVADASRG